jgi:hypothetical protein
LIRYGWFKVLIINWCIDKVIIKDGIDEVAGDRITDEFTGAVIVFAMGIPAGLCILTNPDRCIRILIINIDHVKHDGTRHAAHSLSAIGSKATPSCTGPCRKPVS